MKQADRAAVGLLHLSCPPRTINFKPTRLHALVKFGRVFALLRGYVVLQTTLDASGRKVGEISDENGTYLKASTETFDFLPVGQAHPSPMSWDYAFHSNLKQDVLTYALESCPDKFPNREK